jgi:hypothetical protein
MENKFMLYSIIRQLFTASFLIFFFAGFGQEKNSGKAVPFFSTNDILRLTIKGDIKSLINDVGEERNEHPTIVEYVENNDTIRLNVQIETRGNFRRSKANCNFPPLSLNFKKKEVKNTLFDDINKIKLVTHCKSNSKLFQQYVLEEYLIYRTYNIITDTSYRVRLAFITYYDTVEDEIFQESYSIFIESDKVLEERLNLIEFEKKYVMQDKTKYDHMSKLAVFQYMIGNTDWAVTTLHNIKLFTSDTTLPAYAIPYDFDWSGMVNAMYAVPLPRFGTKSVTERVYRGFCQPLDEFNMTFEYFNSKKTEIYALYQNFDLLKESERKRIRSYLDDFYEIIGNDKLIKVEFLDACLK